MKKILSVSIFLISINFWAQNISDETSTYAANSSIELEEYSAYPESEDVELAMTVQEISKTFKDSGITNRVFSNLKDVNNGFYIITGVFKETKNLKGTVRKLKRKGLENAGYLTNPENGLNYTYAEHHLRWQDALNASTSNLGGKYTEQKWVMIVENSEEPTVIVDNGITPTIKSNSRVDKTKSILNDSVKDKDKKNKLIERADAYFDKLWYAEAALLYEEALKGGEKNYTYQTLQKVGDAHYFNTNMERAYYWYNLLYDKYSSEMSADNLFKYAHSLKGTGKYGRAKRLMRLYNRKVKKENLSITEEGMAKKSPREQKLDKILNADDQFDIKNLAINSEYSDFSPAFHNVNEVVFASAKDSSFLNTRRYKWNNQPYLDLYVAKINEESQDLRNATKFSKKINTKYHEASATFSPDNQTMYFTRNNYGKKLKRDKNGINHLKIYRATKIDGEWSEAEEVSFNSDNYSTGHPALSPDGKKLFFVSDMPGSIGQTDIFVVDVLENGDFSEPRNLGPDVNTEQKEMFPFVNDKKLYFSSNGHVGLGGLDVYEVSFTEEGFSEVKNLGRPINSRKDDFSYIVDEESQKGFFASNRTGGKGDDDIYSFKRLIVEEVNQNAIAGVVTELVTGDIMPEALVVLLDENNIKLKEMVTGDDGSFVFEDLEGNTKYTIKTTKGDYFENIQEITTKDNEVVNTEVSLKKLKEMIAIEDGIKKLKTDMIYFDFDKSYIRKDASLELDKLVEVMTEYKDMVIKIESHTDSRGPRAYNKYLSEKRAKSSRDYLISKGISTDRIESAIGYGEERLLNGCDGTVRCSREQHERNRRSEFIIVSM